jgi:predicted regulator of Ras-like GTPase activity (Roadblock/LC7/MglB family)
MTSADLSVTGDTKTLLVKLVDDTNALTALLITKQGTVISEAGQTASLNATAMAALVAGMFSATREVARMVGEKQFSILLQQGETRHIHISLVTDSAMMVVVFEDHQRIGKIRYAAKKTGEELAQILLNMNNRETSHSDLSVPQFKEYALNLIDQIFTTAK